MTIPTNPQTNKHIFICEIWSNNSVSHYKEEFKATNNEKIREGYQR